MSQKASSKRMKILEYCMRVKQQNDFNWYCSGIFFVCAKHKSSRSKMFFKIATSFQRTFSLSEEGKKVLNFFKNCSGDDAVKIGVLKNFEIFTRKHLCRSLLIRLQVKTCNFIKKTLTHLFSCEYCEIFENLFYKTHSVSASISICLCGTLVYWLRLEFSVSQSHFVKIEN